MIPAGNSLLLQERPVQPTRTFRLQGSAVRGSTVHGFIDRKAALAQTIGQILATERYEWEIFSWQYGVEFRKLIGKDPVYCIPVIEKSIREALLQDDRITGVDSFESACTRRQIACTFTAHTIYGDIRSSTDVEI